MKTKFTIIFPNIPKAFSDHIQDNIIHYTTMQIVGLNKILQDAGCNIFIQTKTEVEQELCDTSDMRVSFSYRTEKSEDDAKYVFDYLSQALGVCVLDVFWIGQEEVGLKFKADTKEEDRIHLQQNKTHCFFGVGDVVKIINNNGESYIVQITCIDIKKQKMNCILLWTFYILKQARKECG